MTPVGPFTELRSQGKLLLPKSEETSKSNKSPPRSVYLEQKQMVNWGQMVFKDEIDKGMWSLVNNGLTPMAWDHAQTPGIRGPRR